MEIRLSTLLSMKEIYLKALHLFYLNVNVAVGAGGAPCCGTFCFLFYTSFKTSRTQNDTSLKFSRELLLLPSTFICELHSFCLQTVHFKRVESNVQLKNVLVSQCNFPGYIWNIYYLSDFGSPMIVSASAGLNRGTSRGFLQNSAKWQM